MRRPARGILTALAILSIMLGVVSTATAAGLPNGTYEVTAKGSQWSLTFNNGKYSVSKDGHKGVEGKYAITGNTITMTDTGGPMAQTGAHATGTYHWTFAAGKLTFSVIKDDGGRMQILTAAPFQKKG